MAAKKRRILKVVKMGDSMLIECDKHTEARLGVRMKGRDRVYCTDTPYGVELMPFDPELAEVMEIADEIMREDHDLLRKLAKS